MSHYLKFAKPDSGGSEILGSSQDAAHADWVELTSLSWNVTRATGAGGSVGPSLPREINFTSEDGKSFNGIFLGCANGTHYPSATVETVGDGRVVLKIVLHDVLISSCQLGSRPKDAYPLVSFVLNAKRVEATVGTAAPAAPSPKAPTPPPPRKSK